MVGAAGCGAPPQESIFFPTRLPTESPGAVSTAIGGGTLVLQDECIFLVSGSQTYLVIWPAGYKVAVEGGRIKISDPSGDKAAYVGDEVRLGGGELHPSDDGRSHVVALIGQELPDSCPASLVWVGGLLREEASRSFDSISQGFQKVLHRPGR